MTVAPRPTTAGGSADAAAELARADALVPNATTLALALRAAMRIDDPVLVMTLVERAELRPPDGALLGASRTARDRFEKRTGRLTIVCPPPRECSAEVDGAVVQVGATLWTTAGGPHHRPARARERALEHRTVHVDAGASIEAHPLPLAEPPSPLPLPGRPVEQRDTPKPAGRQPASRGLSPAWFWIGAGASVVLGGVSAASAFETKNRYAAYTTPTRRRMGRSAGLASELRTNVLFGVIGHAAAVATTAGLGLFAVRVVRKGRSTLAGRIVGGVRRGRPGRDVRREV